MPMPNILLIGAMRSGTTAIYELLGQHPDIFMSPLKEPNFFAFAPGEVPDLTEGSPSVADIETYRELFSGVGTEARIGEASHSYLYYPGSAGRIQEGLGQVRLICILRDPVQRAFSHFMFHLANGRERVSDFSAALDLEAERIAAGQHFGHYVNRGLYARQLREYFAVFPRDDIRVYLYDDFSARPLWLIQDAYRFLGVDDGFAPDTSIRRNPSGLPRSTRLHGLLVRKNPLKRSLQPRLPRSLYRLATRIRDRNLARPHVDERVRAGLQDIFRDDIRELEGLIDRDLSAWLE